jgi:signal recognition particle receptor subunit alpha
VWGGAAGDGGPAQLDFSTPPPPGLGGDGDEAGAGAAADALAPLSLGRSAMDAEEDDDSEDEDYGEEDEAAAGASASGAAAGAKAKAAPPRGWFANVLKLPAVTSVVGKACLERDDVAPILDALKVNLLRKNVASEIADKLCDSVAHSLEGRKLASFTSLAGTVRRAMEEALTRILTPTRSVDILRDVAAARERTPARPYTIVFVGVNGVGKSTNLAKVAYWLGENGAKVLLAACDTFRAGAVEQLRTHATRLGVPLYERGYEKDPAAVAAEGVRVAARTGRDVVLVDTAGRMQDNEPLMRALSKLINTNKPDLVLFVGEALVGNDAVDQLAKFNARLADLADDASKTRVIDGIVLTKFDTIDDKVGAALSMVYTSSAPVMFVGTGQTYTDLKRFNPKTVVKSLLH